MPSKTLTAKVRVDASKAHNSLDKLITKINKINNAVNKQSGKDSLTRNIERATLAQEKLKQATAKTQLAEERVTTQKQKTAIAAQKVTEATTKAQIAEQRLVAQTAKTNSLTQKLSSTKTQVNSKLGTIVSRVRTWASAQKQVHLNTVSTNGVLGSIGSKLRGIAATYLGIMGARAGIKTSDIITSAQNRLNAMNGGDVELTQNQMDKMYASANKVRMVYTDMLSNASKSMTLAGDAFQGNMDNAIRFQEIMAETYALGGASAEEMSTSMYQMIQALGAGTLAGDELRSVREGAPLAYKAIEDYVQGVMAQSDATKDYATKSLKDIASAGLVTSEMVVAAVMDAGDKVDKQFEETAMTFGQAWNRIKSSAIKAFEPVSNALNKMLNEAAENGAFEKIENAFWNISKVIQIVFKLIQKAVSWMADNWNVVVFALSLICAYLIATGTIAVANAIMTAVAWIKAHWVLLLIVAAIALVIYSLYLWKTGAIDTCDLISNLFIALGIVILTVLAKILLGWLVAAGIMTAGTAWLVLAIVAAVLVVLYFIIKFFKEVCFGVAFVAGWIVNAVIWLAQMIASLVAWIAGIVVNIAFAIWNIIIFVIQVIASGVVWLVSTIINLAMATGMAIGTIVQWTVAFITNLTMGVVNFISACVYDVGAFIVNTARGLGNVISAVCTNIGVAFSNAWNGAASSFWTFIADCIDGLNWLAKPLEAIAELFGKSFNYSDFAAGIRGRASGYSQKSYVSVGDAWSSGFNSVEYKNPASEFSEGWNTMDYADMGAMVSSGWNTVDAGGAASGTWNAMNGLYADFVNPEGWMEGTWNAMDSLHFDPKTWGDAAENWGAGIENKVNGWGDKLKDSMSMNGLSLDSIGKSLGLDFGNVIDPNGGGFPSASDPKYGVGDAYNGPSPEDMIANALGDKLDDIAGDTGSIADSMELTKEDLDYLRKIADMEWKKEFTTASIVVEMNNNNSINGDSDLDGIVTKLSDKLYEELNSVANGVYV